MHSGPEFIGHPRFDSTQGPINNHRGYACKMEKNTLEASEALADTWPVQTAI